MNNRDFSYKVKLEVITANLKKNNGELCCEICGKKLQSIDQGHYDHVYPFAKGGKSTLENCQLLCADCNLKKNDKELQDFILEEKAKQLLNGALLSDVNSPVNNTDKSHKKMTKELFDKTVRAFIQKKGNVSKADFGKEQNELPSIHYVREYYGNLNNLKTAFGVENLSYNWNRDNIQEALTSFVARNGDISQNNLTKANKLPSVPCIIRHFPEFENFTDIKKGLCNLTVPVRWTKEIAIEYGKTFASKHGKITQKDLKAKNRLPSPPTIDKLFGSLLNYQEAVGAEIPPKKEFISKEKITEAVNLYFNGKERIIRSQKSFFKTFVYSPHIISERYGTFASFCEEHGIKVLLSKKAKYSKREVDDAISKWVKEGHEIPASKDLSQLGLPSRDTILKFYETWKEPFYIYSKICEEYNRH